MKLFSRVQAAVLALALTAALCLPAAAAEDSRLLPSLRSYDGFSDVKDTWCEPYVSAVYEAGLMEGVSSAAFAPEAPLSVQAAVVLAARLHSLLTGGDGTFAPSSPWYLSAQQYLLDEENDVMGAPWFVYSPEGNCTRADLAALLYPVLAPLPDTLEPINTVTTVPDCDDYEVIALYEAGILTGTDRYGTFRGGQTVTRGETAAILARVIDPSLRRSFTLTPFDLGQVVLGIPGETVVETVDGYAVRSELLADLLLRTTARYVEEHGDQAYPQYAAYWKEYAAQDWGMSYFEYLYYTYDIDLTGTDSAVAWDQAGSDGLSPAQKVWADTLDAAAQLAVLFSHARAQDYTPDYFQKQTIASSEVAQGGRSAWLNRELAVFDALRTNLAAQCVPTAAQANAVLRENGLVCGIPAMFDTTYGLPSLVKAQAETMRQAAAAHPGDWEYFSYLTEKYADNYASVDLLSRYDFASATWSALDALAPGQISPVLEENGTYLVFYKVDPAADKDTMDYLGQALAAGRLAQWAQDASVSRSGAWGSWDEAACCARCEALEFPSV